jgi:hypothetical protein
MEKMKETYIDLNRSRVYKKMLALEKMMIDGKKITKQDLDVLWKDLLPLLIAHTIFVQVIGDAWKLYQEKGDIIVLMEKIKT